MRYIILPALLIFGVSAHGGPAMFDAEPDTARLAASGIHDAPRVHNGFENNDGPLPSHSIIKWRWHALVHGLPRPPENGYAFPVDHPDVEWIKANRSQDTLTWIGHASTLLQLNGLNILIDPVFSERASPLRWLGPKRRVQAGLALSELPHIDVVLISHSHYDHLDTASVVALNQQPGGAPRFLVPLGIKTWMSSKGIVNAEEFDWGQRTRVIGLDFWFVPATHWSARGVTDRNRSLWGGWVIKTIPQAERPYSVYFAGDSGYSKDFQRIGDAFGGFDLALLPIGAYAPRWFMQGEHMDPADAVKAFQDVRASKAIGVHWGTFELTDEPLDEPPKKLAQALHAANLKPDAFVVMRHGQTLRLGRGQMECYPHGPTE